jgi:hypothetical protein
MTSNHTHQQEHRLSGYSDDDVLTVLNGGKPPKKEPTAKKPDKTAVGKKGASKGEEDPPALPPADVSLTSGLDAVLVLNSSSSSEATAVCAEMQTFWNGFAGGALSAAVQLEVAGESPAVPTAAADTAAATVTATASTAAAAAADVTETASSEAASTSAHADISGDRVAAAAAVEARLTETLYLLLEAAAERRTVTAAVVATTAAADVSGDVATVASTDAVVGAGTAVSESAAAVGSSSVVMLTDGLEQRRAARRQVRLMAIANVKTALVNTCQVILLTEYGMRALSRGCP